MWSALATDTLEGVSAIATDTLKGDMVLPGSGTILSEGCYRWRQWHNPVGCRCEMSRTNDSKTTIRDISDGKRCIADWRLDSKRGIAFQAMQVTPPPLTGDSCQSAMEVWPPSSKIQILQSLPN